MISFSAVALLPHSGRIALMRFFEHNNVHKEIEHIPRSLSRWHINRSFGDMSCDTDVDEAIEKKAL